MRKTRLVIVSVLLWIYFVVSSVILTPIALTIWLLTVLFDKNLKILHRFSCFWGAQYIWVVPYWRLKIYDRKKFNNNKAYILVSNHQSLADIVVIYSLFKHFRWTSKVENFKAPFVGWVLTLNKSIRIYRGASDAYRIFEEQAFANIMSGNSIMIFPEGTRSKSGNIGHFKEGAFKIAQKTKADILPMVLDGTSKAIPKSGWILTGRQEMILKVLDPVVYDTFKDLTPAQTSELIKEKISLELNKLRSDLK